MVTKEKKKSVITLRMMEKKQLRKFEKKGKRDQLLTTLEERSSFFNNVQIYSTFDARILTTSACRLIQEDFRDGTHEGPTYICDICWKFEFRSNVVIVHDSKYH